VRIHHSEEEVDGIIVIG